MSLAADTRRAVDDHPFLVHALRAGVCNFTAAARFLDVDGDTDAVATALRRYAEDLPRYERASRDARVTMRSGVGTVEEGETLLTVGQSRLGADGGDSTAILATGTVGSRALATALDSLALAGISVTAAGVGAESMVIVVDRLEGANAVRVVERTRESVPTA